jgi:hypothetical protein
MTISTYAACDRAERSALRHSRCRTSASIKPLPGRNSDIRVQLLPSGMGAPQRTTACDFSEPGAFCTAWDNVWRRWPEHFCPPDGKADFHGDRGDAYPVHRPTGCFPVAFVRASDHSLSLACRSRCGDKGRGDQRAHASAALRSSGTTAGRRRSQSGQAPPGFPATCRSSEAVRHRG